MNICVFGAASDKISAEYIKDVEAFALELAKKGHNLVFGGGGSGLMGAAARGFYKGGAKIYGVIPSFFIEEGVELIFDKCTELFVTETMRERKAKMEELADAFIIVPGGIGTYEEFFEILTSKQLRRHDKPIAVYNFKSYYDKIKDSLEFGIEENFISENCRNIYHFSDDKADIIDYVENDSTKEFSIKDLKLG